MADHLNQSTEPWAAKWGKGEKLDGGGQGDTFLVPGRTDPHGVMKLQKDTRVKDPKSRRRMFQEVTNLKVLHNAGAKVPQVLDDNTKEFENLDIPLFFVMERIKGQTLAQLIADKKKLDLSNSISLTLDLCKTFEIAFRERISHRDIKPENLIVMSLEKPEVFVVDFGLSFNEITDEKLTDVDEAFDNKFISPPERRGPGENKRDPRSDITGLCAVFFYCLTGCAPRNLRNSKNQPPHRWENFSMIKIGPSLNHVALLDALFDRGFNYELQNRFQSLSEFIQRVQELLKADLTLPVEDLAVIAERESNVLRETDRATFMNGLRNQANSIQRDLQNHAQLISRKLNNSLFYVTQPSVFPGDTHAEDVVFNFTQDVCVQSNQSKVGVQYQIKCIGNECMVHRRIYDIIYTGQRPPLNTPFEICDTEDEIVFRYDGKLGKPDIAFLINDFEKAVGLAVSRLRKLILTKTLLK